ncbi:hypothetical protein Moror_14682 [Moniliophthora roreri MCA 2997]|uniref:Uncharacterized protein n=2 Tax=Moniliophthora roreri TaxID=221103 RepID=V2X6N1_MONRO|nr:hypothetical protein Moror_14682 [Moniliophthora roreri MCA 2997]KAI3619563.1 hypothetical protein WG66_002713 [Moniliophthora roreri]
MAKPKVFAATAPPVPEKTLATTQRTESGAIQIIRYYLVFYNVLLTIGWSYILIFTLIHIFDPDGKASAVTFDIDDRFIDSFTILT